VNPFSEAEQRLYEELSAMTESTPTAQRMLDQDVGLQRCLRALSGEEPATLDAYLGCYGEDDHDAEITNSEQRLYEELSEMTGVPIRPTPEPSDTGYVLVPADLVKQIDRTYEEVSRHGFLTEAAREEWLYEEFSALLGVGSRRGS